MVSYYSVGFLCICMCDDLTTEYKCTWSSSEVLFAKCLCVIFSDVQRNEFLHKLLKRLDSRQLYFLCSSLAVSSGANVIAGLIGNSALMVPCNADTSMSCKRRILQSAEP